MRRGGGGGAVVVVLCVPPRYEETLRSQSQVNKGMMAERAKRSKVWLYFSKIDANNARCNKCLKSISCKSGNTSNLSKHLSTVHQLQTERCTVFDRPSTPASSDTAATADQPPPPVPPPSTAGVDPFTLAASGRLSEERVKECHKTVTKFIVKGLHPFSTVDSKEFRDMCKTLNQKYIPPSRRYLSDTLIPAWYAGEKDKLILELTEVPKLAITSDAWTSLSQDHYLTVTVHYTTSGMLKHKVLHTKAVYQSQTGEVVSEEIADILEDFKIPLNKVCGVTVDNAGNLDVAIRTLGLLKIACFAHTLNLAAQKIYTIPAVDRWASQIRSVVVIFKRSSMAHTVLKEKQQLLGTSQHTLILDVRTRWNSLYLMIERFMEQYPAIQAALLDPRLHKAKAQIGRLKDEVLHKAEEFVQLMKVLYTSTLCVSEESTATSGQIMPILQKLEEHFTESEEDTMFVSSIKQQVWGNLSGRYQDHIVQDFLQEATAMDPRFKARNVSDATWERVKRAAAEPEQASVSAAAAQAEEEEKLQEEPKKKMRKRSALEELFEEEERLQTTTGSTTTSSILSSAERLDQEVEIYKGLPAISMREDPVMWWWNKRNVLPMLFKSATGYLCVQASSTPSERVFSTAGNTISQDRSRLLPEKANMLIFLQKNSE